MRIGEILCRSGLISDDQLDYALHLQQHTRERLGSVLINMGACSQEQIDQTLLTASVRGPVEAAINHACDERFTAILDRTVRFVAARRRTVTIENLLDSGVETATSVSIEVLIELAAPGRPPLQVRAAIDPDEVITRLDPEDCQRIREWVGNQKPGSKRSPRRAA